MSWLSFFMILFGLSWIAVGLYRWYAVEKGLLDTPNARSSHSAPTPRGGGVVFFVGWMMLLCVLHYCHMVTREYLWLFSPVLLVGSVGFWDDHKGLSAGIRFLAHCVAAAICLFLLGEGGGSLHAWISLPLPVCFIVTVIAMVWMTNLYNFMDGADGIAATEGIFVFAVAGTILFQLQAFELAILSWGLVALLVGFLTWNWPMARIFMGDSGSCFLGFMIVLYALMSYKRFNMPLIIWVILTALFWFDATLTLLRRMFAGENWRKPHRSHAYQRLLQAGWSHQQVLISTMAVNTCLSLLAWLVYRDPRLGPFAFCLAVTLLSCLYILVEITKPMYRSWYTNQPTQDDIYS